MTRASESISCANHPISSLQLALLYNDIIYVYFPIIQIINFLSGSLPQPPSAITSWYPPKNTESTPYTRWGLSLIFLINLNLTSDIKSGFFPRDSRVREPIFCLCNIKTQLCPCEHLCLINLPLRQRFKSLGEKSRWKEKQSLQYIFFLSVFASANISNICQRCRKRSQAMRESRSNWAHLCHINGQVLSQEVNTAVFRNQSSSPKVAS